MRCFKPQRAAALVDVLMLSALIVLVAAMAVRTFGQDLLGKWDDAAYFLRLRITINGTLSSGGTASLGTAEANGTLYTDQPYTMGALSPVLDGGHLLQFPNTSQDRRNRDANYVTFTLTQSATIYVGYDQSASFLPAWMSGYTATPHVVLSDNPSTPGYRVYQRDVTEGTYSLGGNWNPLNTGALSNYFVIIRQR